MALWIISYHIDFEMDDGTTVTKKDMRTAEDASIDTEDKAKKWISDRYENSEDPMVDMAGLLAGVKNEKFIIDEIILHEFDSGSS
jgi:hypothetical protein